jgi:hypothetical protein
MEERLVAFEAPPKMCSQGLHQLSFPVVQISGELHSIHPVFQLANKKASERRELGAR